MFWHIPWPNPEVFRVLPWRQEILEGMLANDVVGFHIRRHAMNFLDSVAETLEARVDLERLAVDRAGRRTWVRPFAISVDAEEIAALAEAPETRRAEAEIRERLGPAGLQDRPRRGPARLHQGHPGAVRGARAPVREAPRVAGAASPSSRSACPPASSCASTATCRRARGAGPRPSTTASPGPAGPTVHLIEANLDFRELVPYYRMADLCTVTSLHDGMNLVAKEYLAASPDLEGALVLSPFTGAARELERAWIASPYDREGLADAYHAALSEPAGGAPRAHGARCARPCCAGTSSTGCSTCSTPSSA